MALLLEDLLRTRPVWRGAALSTAPAALSTGFAALDAQLPGGGWPRGALTELLSREQGIGELQLLLPAIAALPAAGKRVVWLAPPYLPYAPALAAAGVDLAHVTLLRAPQRHDALWTAEQVLRASSCHALLAWLPRIRYAELRRLAVAAEASGALAALFRPWEAARESSPACLRLALEPADGALSVRILKRRGPLATAPLVLRINRPVHALGRDALSAPAARLDRAGRRVDVPVHP